MPGQCHRADESASTARAIQMVIVAQQRLQVGDSDERYQLEPHVTNSMKKAQSALRADLAKVDEAGTLAQEGQGSRWPQAQKNFSPSEILIVRGVHSSAHGCIQVHMPHVMLDALAGILPLLPVACSVANSARPTPLD